MTVYIKGVTLGPMPRHRIGEALTVTRVMQLVRLRRHFLSKQAMPLHVVVARDWTVPTTTANERQPMAFYLCSVITSGVLLKMEVGIRKGAWRRA